MALDHMQWFRTVQEAVVCASADSNVDAVRVWLRKCGEPSRNPDEDFDVR